MVNVKSLLYGACALVCVSVLAGCCCHAKPRKPCMTEVVAVEAVECAVPAQNQSADAPAAPAVPAPAQAK
jgi:hypothetical protein